MESILKIYILFMLAFQKIQHLIKNNHAPLKNLLHDRGVIIMQISVILRV
jgi:hypothetical protein